MEIIWDLERGNDLEKNEFLQTPRQKILKLICKPTDKI
jgi:hypothetical protein